MYLVCGSLLAVRCKSLCSWTLLEPLASAKLNRTIRVNWGSLPKKLVTLANVANFWEHVYHENDENSIWSSQRRTRDPILHRTQCLPVPAKALAKGKVRRFITSQPCREVGIPSKPAFLRKSTRFYAEVRHSDIEWLDTDISSIHAKILILSGAKVRKYCRSGNMLQHGYLIANRLRYHQA